MFIRLYVDIYGKICVYMFTCGQIVIKSYYFVDITNIIP